MPLAFMTIVFVLLSLVPLQRNYAIKQNLIEDTRRLEVDLRKSIEEYRSMQQKLDGTFVNRDGDLPSVHAVILVRIYDGDKAKWSKKDLKDWLRYLKYAGVAHVYLYDNYLKESESLRSFLREEVGDFVTYHDWSKYQPYTISGSQISAYHHARNNYKDRSDYQMAWDMDEYPFAQDDMEPGFLLRAVAKLQRKHPKGTDFSCRNFLFLGKPINGDQVVQRFLRRTPREANNLAKSIYDPVDVSPKVHLHMRRKGLRITVDPRILRINHYWGQRLQNWGEDTEEILKKTIPDRSAVYIAKAISENSAYSFT